ncbi:MAG: hypothetical protein JSS68_12885 [Actinobacteria bacterium]|nr:hypothetical protein [Actinomycetota bacterium]
MGRLRAVAIALTATLLVLALAASGASAAPQKGHDKPHERRIVAAPTPNQVVHANVAQVVINARSARNLRVRLNRSWVPARELRRGHDGTRRLEASLSQGLRAGPNRLTVSYRQHGKRRRAVVHFSVDPSAPLLGAGRDEGVSIGESIRLAAKLEPGAPASATDRIAWTPLRVPAADSPSCEPSGTKAILRSPGGRTASFTPRAPGEYRYRVTEGSGANAVSDVVGFKASYRSRMVTIDTMAGSGAAAGIKVGYATYLLSQAKAQPGAEKAGLQVLILKRETLECVSNQRIGKVSELEADLASHADPGTYLVIVALQPGTDTGGLDGKGLYQALGKIGFPTEGDKALPTGAGTLSGVGVSGFKRGDANVDILPAGAKESAAMTGYLTPDQWNAFGFIPTLSQPFDWAVGKPAEPCKEARQCEAATGYRLIVQNPRTGHVEENILYTTGEAGEATVMAGLLVKNIEEIPTGDVVQLIATSNRTAAETSYPPSLGQLGAIHQTLYDRLVAAVTSIGGTRNGFNRTAYTRGSLAGGGLTYALVGWKGAKESEGAEAAAGVFGQTDAPRLIGILRPDNRSLLRPTLESEVKTGTNLADVVMEKPSEKWPLEGDAGAMRAFAYLGNAVKLSEHPRHEYWEGNFSAARWAEFAKAVEAIKYQSVPAGERASFTEAQFKAANAELAQELLWVAKVREYIDNISEPFSSNAFAGWATAEELAKKIYAETKATDEETGLRWFEFTSIMLKLAGPLTAHISNTIAELMDLGVWGFGATKSGAPTYDEVSIKATELAGELRKEMEGAAATYKSMFQVVVSDPSKLAEVGSQAECQPTEKSCNPEFDFKEKERVQVSADISRSIQRLAFEKLIPTFYLSYKLNKDLYPEQVNGEPRDPGIYLCGGIHHTWSRFSDEEKRLATTALLEERDVEHGGRRNRWQILVLAEPATSEFDYYGRPPNQEKVLERLFHKVPDNSFPEAGGLGASSEAFIAGIEPRSLWDPTNSTNPPEDSCVWQA